jgi:hypothetical protein
MSKTQMILKALLDGDCEAEGCTLQQSLRDLITDLKHVAHANQLDWDFALEGAEEVFLEEKLQIPDFTSFWSQRMEDWIKSLNMDQLREVRNRWEEVCQSWGDDSKFYAPLAMAEVWGIRYAELSESSIPTVLVKELRDKTQAWSAS